MQDPHPPHPEYGWNSCPTPATALWGDRWVCPICAREYVAVDDDGEGTFEWVLMKDRQRY